MSLASRPGGRQQGLKSGREEQGGHASCVHTGGEGSSHAFSGSFSCVLPQPHSGVHSWEGAAHLCADHVQRLPVGVVHSHHAARHRPDASDSDGPGHHGTSLTAGGRLIKRIALHVPIRDGARRGLCTATQLLLKRWARPPRRQAPGHASASVLAALAALCDLVDVEHQ
eukprot:259731-Chlamydomonas_euryale.AAC.18